jgi:hypothetical protein
MKRCSNQPKDLSLCAAHNVEPDRGWDWAIGRSMHTQLPSRVLTLNFEQSTPQCVPSSPAMRPLVYWMDCVGRTLSESRAIPAQSTW